MGYLKYVQGALGVQLKRTESTLRIPEGFSVEVGEDCEYQVNQLDLYL